MILFFYGPNSFASRQKLREVVERYKKSAGSEFGLERFDESASEAEPIVAGITSQPFLTEHRLIVIEDLLSNKTVAAAVLPALKRVPKENVVVFYEQTPDERTKVFKDLKKLAKTVKFEPLKPHQLLNWLRQTAQELGGSLDNPSASYLIEQAGSDQWNLWQNLQKLINFEPSVTRETIDELVEPVFEKTIFDLVEALARGNAKRALECYRGLRIGKAEPLYILSMIGWQLRNLIVVKAAGSRSNNAIAKDIGMNPFVVNKSRMLSQKLEPAKLKRLYINVVNTDRQLKTTPIEPDILLQQLIATAAAQLQPTS